MKIHLHIDNAYQQVEIHIYTAEYTEAVEKLMQQLNQPATATMIGYIQQDIHVLLVDDIYAVISEGAKIYLQSSIANHTNLRVFGSSPVRYSFKGVPFFLNEEVPY